MTGPENDEKSARQSRRPLPPPVPLRSFSEESLLQGKLDLQAPLRFELSSYSLGESGTIGKLVRALESGDPVEALQRKLPGLARQGGDVFAHFASMLDPADLNRLGTALAGVLKNSEGSARESERRAVLNLVSQTARVFALNLNEPGAAEGAFLLLGAMLKAREAGSDHRVAQELAAQSLLAALRLPGSEGECSARSLVAWKNRRPGELYLETLQGVEKEIGAGDGFGRSRAALVLAASAGALLRSKKGEAADLGRSILKSIERRFGELAQGLADPGTPNGCAIALCSLVESRDERSRRQACKGLRELLADPGRSAGLVAGHISGRPFYNKLVASAYLLDSAESLGGRAPEALALELSKRPASVRKLVAGLDDSGKAVLVDLLDNQYPRAPEEVKRAISELVSGAPELLQGAARHPLSRMGAAGLSFDLTRSAVERGESGPARELIAPLHTVLRHFGMQPDKILRVSPDGKSLQGAWTESDAKERMSARFEDTVRRMAEVEAAQPGGVKLLATVSGLRHFGRYPKELLIEQAKLLASGRRPEAGYVGVFYPAGDYNGAFWYSPLLENAMKQAGALGAPVVVTESANPAELLGKLLRITKRLGALEVAIFGGHGSEHSVSLKEFVSVGLAAIEAVKNKGLLTRIFAPDPSILLFSCSTGARWGIAEQGASLLRSIEATFYAPLRPAYLDRIDLRITRAQEGRLAARATFGDAGSARYREEPWLARFLRAFAMPHA